jgi:signal transduction histidine kinase/ActR/RegA family two-component response regulator
MGRSSRFRDLSVNKKLLLVITLTSCIALLIACGAFVTYDLVSFRQKMVEEISILAEIIGNNSSAALVFDDPESASEVLSALGARPSIHSASIRTVGGQIFASYSRSGESGQLEGAVPDNVSERFEGGYLHLSRPIVLEGETVGSVHVRTDLSEFSARTQRYSTIVVIVFLVSALVALWLSSRMRAMISSPIRDLAEAANRVSGEQDYATRVAKRGNDELGVLTDSFNGMLGQIQRRDAELKTAHGELESRVEQLQQEIAERERAEKALQESEKQLRQAQKMEAVGQLAGGVAHDFNNLLTAIKGYSEISLMRLKTDDPLRGNIEEINRASDRAAALTRQLLAFSRKQIFAPKNLDLNEAVKNMEKMLKRLIGEDIQLTTIPDSQLPLVKADPVQLEQIILNLVVNARDAMPTGGKITITTGNVRLGADYAEQFPEVIPGSYVLLSVSDTGCGMDADTQTRIFEPFYTTKEQGKGTGLGLSTVYGIVKQSGGHVSLYSEPGAGTCFRVHLPQAQCEDKADETAGRETSIHKGTETILLVEDEDLVRKMAHEVLSMSGYKVLEAPHGDEAIELCRRHDGEIHLVLTDVVMPRMNGKEVVERISPLRPDMKVLYMSGYDDKAIVHHGVLEEGVAFLPKPFSPSELAAKVREVLEGVPVAGVS